MGYAVTKSATFLRWLKELRDKRAQARIAIRIDRVQEGILATIRPSEVESASSVSLLVRGTESTTRYEKGPW